LVNHNFNHNYFLTNRHASGETRFKKKFLANPKTSSLTGLAIADGVAITAHEVYTVTMTVGGAIESIKAGEYKGKILITVTKC
jgi:hypothetical protein